MKTDHHPISENCQPVELLIHDDRQPCPYLPGLVARMPLRMPTNKLTPVQLDDLLSRGDRRSGWFLYRTRCPTCHACEPIRIDVDAFKPSQGQRRIFRIAQELLTVDLGTPKVSPERIDLFNAHRHQRGLAGKDDEIDEIGYQAFLVDSCCDSVEIRYRLDDRLIAVAICDMGIEGISAVYCYYDPAFSRLSLGTFSILKQIQLCRSWGKQFVYLGLYIAASPHMSYKARFRPHQRLIHGRWQSFDG